MPAPSEQILEAQRLAQEKRAEETLKTRSEIAVDELRTEVRDAQVYGYDYLDVSTVERGMIAIAVLHGAENITSLEAAINYLEVFGATIAGKDNEIDVLQKEKNDVDEKRIAAEDRVELLEETLSEHKDVKNGVVVGARLVEKTVEALEQTRTVLNRVPGQRELAQQALRSANQLRNIGEPHLYVNVTAEGLHAAFSEDHADPAEIKE